jgi:hypothetical protein
MGIFGSIKNAIFGKDEEAAKPTLKPAAKPQQTRRPGAIQQQTPRAAPAPSQGTAPRPLQEVDVEKRLDGMSGADKLNWRSSIVDLMKLIGIDSSFGNRKELATELGDSDYSGTAEENIWLHKRTMQELAKNGGKVPKQFLD